MTQLFRSVALLMLALVAMPAPAEQSFDELRESLAARYPNLKA